MTCLFLLASFAGAVALSGDQYNETHLINRMVITSPEQAPSLNEPGRVEELEKMLGTTSAVMQGRADLLMLAAERDSWRGEARNREVRLVGQVRKSKGENHVVRLLSICCAADARPLGVIVDEEAVRGFSTGDWVNASGRIEFLEKSGQWTPALRNTRLVKVRQPQDTILY